MALPVTDAFPRTVLIVDDEPTVLTVLATTLKRHGLDTRSAATGEEAIALLNAERFGCVLTDKNLPGVNGLEVIAQARRLHPSCACLLMTGYPSADTVLAAMRLGALDYLEKPFADLKILVQKIDNAMEHARTAFERAALAQTLQEMASELKQNEEKSFQQQTELGLFEQVLEVRVEEATRTLVENNQSLQAGAHELHQQLLAAAARVSKVSEALMTQAGWALAESQRTGGTVEQARHLLADLAKALEKASEDLRS